MKWANTVTLNGIGICSLQLQTSLTKVYFSAEIKYINLRFIFYYYLKNCGGVEVVILLAAANSCEG